MGQNKPLPRDMGDPAATAGPDSNLNTLTDSELRDLISKAQAELDKRSRKGG